MTPEINDALADLIRTVSWILVLGFIGCVYHFCG